MADRIDKCALSWGRPGQTRALVVLASHSEESYGQPKITWRLKAHRQFGKDAPISEIAMAVRNLRQGSFPFWSFVVDVDSDHQVTIQLREELKGSRISVSAMTIHDSDGPAAGAVTRENLFLYWKRMMQKRLFEAPADILPAWLDHAAKLEAGQKWRLHDDDYWASAIALACWRVSEGSVGYQPHRII